jgi:RNA polymerase sigma-70 factor, ECF subfamily
MLDNSTFETHRPLLFGIAYRMLGSAMEAEDMVQEAWLRYQAVDATTVQSPKAFLGTIVTRLCLDRLKAAQTQREEYIGPWLPEPLLTSEAASGSDSLNRVIQMETISMAFLLVMERLNPYERAVFLLREVFDYDYDEIATMIGKDEAACRQIFHRAKQHVHAHRPRFTSTPDEQQRVIQEFMVACSTGDMQGLMALLAPEVISWSDGGGKASAATRPVYGAEKVAKFILGILKRAADYEVAIRIDVKQINAELGILMYVNEVLFEVIVPEIANGQIQTIRFIVNPDKLRHIASQ